jgi:hypothetical protein
MRPILFTSLTAIDWVGFVKAQELIGKGLETDQRAAKDVFGVENAQMRIG